MVDILPIEALLLLHARECLSGLSLQRVTYVVHAPGALTWQVIGYASQESLVAVFSMATVGSTLRNR